MSVSVSEFLSPAGPIGPAFFPSDTPTALTQRIAGYINQGQVIVASLSGSTSDAALRNYVLWRAYDAAHDLLIMRPSTMDFDGKGSTEYSPSQIAAVQEKALQYKAKLDAQLASGGLSPHARPETAITKNKFVF